MIKARVLALAVSGLLLGGLSLPGRNLSQYRELHLDTDLNALAKQTEMTSAEAKKEKNT